jgi:predicted MFS family arabinose efflux permease
VSFVGDAFAWGSWPSDAIVAGALGLLALAGWVEARAAEPILPLPILRQRTTALAILGSLAAGTAMYGAAVFLTQYFQLARGFSPAAAGLLTIPMMAGILVSSLVGGRLISRTGRVKPFLVTGAVLLTVGLGLLGLTGARTPLVLMGLAMMAVGAGIGLTMQNFVLVVQNTVPLRDIGTASSTIAFFRSLGGTIGVSVLGAIYARHIDTHAAADVAYGNATGTVFLISAAAVSLRPVSLRTSLDLPVEPQPARG